MLFWMLLLFLGFNIRDIEENKHSRGGCELPSSPSRFHLCSMAISIIQWVETAEKKKIE